MRRVLKRSASLFLVPLTKWYLRKERTYTYKKIQVSVFPGVFHPGFFSSTAFILGFLEDQALRKTSLLELGCGTGLISIVAAKAGAIVSACDLSQAAVKNARTNFEKNQVTIDLVHSDLFDAISKKTFDWIVINPPYYAKKIHNDAELAWHCGENFQYFQKLFPSLKSYTHQNSYVIMVLTLGCDLDSIFKIAKSHHFKFETIKEKDVLFDGKDLLYRVKSSIHLSEAQPE